MRATAGYLAKCFDYDSETGILLWRTRPLAHFKDARAAASWNVRYAGHQAGTINEDGYYQCTVAGETIRSHVIAWALHYGVVPTSLLDHRDRNRSNNAITNLRECTKADNSHNLHSAKPNITGFKGVSKSGAKFTAQICVNSKKIHLGTFPTDVDAHAAYQKAAVQHHGEFANFGEQK